MTVETFSIGEAIGSGFQLIRRRPRAVAAWWLLYLAFAVLFYGGLFATMGGDIAGLMQAASEGREPDGAAMLAMQSRMMAFQPLLMLGGLVMFVVLGGAIFRAELFPNESRFAYLRLGTRELWMGLTVLVAIIMMGLAGLLMMLPFFIAMAAAGVSAAGGQPSGLGVLASVALAIAGVVGWFWVVLRLSLAGPMSFATNRFALFEAWALTKGQALRLLAVGVTVLICVWVLELLVVGVAMGLVFAVSGGDPERFAGLSAAAKLRTFAPMSIILGLVISALFTALLVVMYAPWASIYRQLTPDPNAAEVFS